MSRFTFVMLVSNLDSNYSQSNMKKIQRNWDEFFAVSVGVGTAS
ncbi:hypothetical protein [Psychrobacter sp. Cmf 22.2]|nr:hypothetical protein [Psychrobacter sp. Cmf 22.2]